MSISEDQEVAARIFLQSYSAAFNTLKESAYREKQTEKYNSFLERVIQAKKDGSFNGATLLPSRSLAEREVRLFQFSHYVFLKHFAGYDSYKGDYQKFRELLDRGLASLKQSL